MNAETNKLIYELSRKSEAEIIEGLLGFSTKDLQKLITILSKRNAELQIIARTHRPKIS